MHTKDQPLQIKNSHTDTLTLSNGIIVNRLLNFKYDKNNLKFLVFPSNFLSFYFIINSSMITLKKINSLEETFIDESPKDENQINSLPEDEINNHRLLIQIPIELLENWRSAFKIPKWLDTNISCLDKDIFINIKQKKIIFLTLEILHFPSINCFNFLEFESLVLFLFSNLLSIQKTENNTNKIDSILEIIHSDPFLKISINDLAKLVGTNESYLRQEFKEQVGITIGNYIKQTKIKEAKKMIIQKNLRIKDIAKLCGYNDVGYFSKIIKNTN